MNELLESELTGLRAKAPAATTRAVALGTGIATGFSVFEAPVGEVAVTFTPDGVQAVRLVEEVGPEVMEARPPRAWGDRIHRALEEGRPGDLPLDLSVTPFRRKVLDRAASIPKGEVRSYGWLARHVGSPGASRAVGSAMATNPVPLIFPCHRVVRSDGRIGAYSLGGPDNKWKLLRHEGADPDQLERLAGAGVRYVASDTTGIFCVPSCSRARRIQARHRLELRTDREAEEAELRPCRVCRPLG